jgi:hypothetical protein
MLRSVNSDTLRRKLAGSGHGLAEIEVDLSFADGATPLKSRFNLSAAIEDISG